MRPASATSKKDDWHWHYFDTVKGGDWLVDQDAAELLAKEASETVIDLEHDGVAFSRTEDGHIAQRRFGGHTKDFGKEPVRRAAYAATASAIRSSSPCGSNAWPKAWNSPRNGT